MIQNQKELLRELKQLKSKYNVIGIKSSFEDEGVQFNELIRLKQLCNLSNIIFNIKIGGCEAISDINNCMLLDTDGIVAPMIESPFALEKFITPINNNGAGNCSNFSSSAGGVGGALGNSGATSGISTQSGWGYTGNGSRLADNLIPKWIGEYPDVGCDAEYEVVCVAKPNF